MWFLGEWRVPFAKVPLFDVVWRSSERHPGLPRLVQNVWRIRDLSVDHQRNCRNLTCWSAVADATLEYLITPVRGLKPTAAFTLPLCGGMRAKGSCPQIQDECAAVVWGYLGEDHCLFDLDSEVV